MHRPPVSQGPTGQRVLAAACGFFGLFSVGPLLAWVYGLGSFALWMWLGAVPGLVFAAVTGIVLRRSGRYPTLLVALVAGALGGLLGTIGYDLVRAPFVAIGYRLYAPVSTYGILMTGASHSSHLTETLGWLYNFANGTGFGIAYAMFGLGRRWWWAIPFALALETTTVVSPYAGMYGLAGHWDIIAIAYGAHVVYGTPLGIIVQRAARWEAAGPSLPPVSWALAGTALLMVVLLQPWVVQTEPPAMGGRPQVLVSGARFQPAWTRVPVGGCVVLTNNDNASYQLTVPASGPPLAPHVQHAYCYPSAGVKRVQLNGVPYSGGWVLVDPAMTR